MIKLNLFKKNKVFAPSFEMIAENELKSVSGGVTIDDINGTDPNYVKQEPGNVSIEDFNEKMKELAQQVSTEQGDTQNTEEWPSEVGLNVDQTQIEFTKAEVKHF